MSALSRVLVEMLLNMANDGGVCPTPGPIMAELCRHWLAIEAAPIGVVDRMGDDEDGNPRLVIGMTRIEIRDMPNVMFKRVRLLALDSGGAGEVGDNFNHNEEKGYG